MLWISGFGAWECRGTFCAWDNPSPQMAIATVSLAWNCIASILMPNLQPGQITVVLGRKAQLCGLYQGASSDVPHLF